ncbi:MAG: UbiD family decarboxylase, partial [Candidatus Rokubacteria bacterium]|nr:UbiD family decarboxylase [Candidatus Rokubacteria bacterium]
MPFTDLRHFISHLESRGELRRITVPVSRDLEIPEITDRISKGPDRQNTALLFEHVEGFELPVLINAFGSARRMAWALGVEDLNELSARVEKLLDLKMPGTFFDKLKKLGDLFDLAKAGPKRVGVGPCQEVVETRSPSLKSLPVLQCWPKDAGYYITLPLVFTRDPESGARNVGMYRLQVFDDRTL